MLNSINETFAKMLKWFLIVAGIVEVIVQIDIATGNAISRLLLKR